MKSDYWKQFRTRGEIHDDKLWDIHQAGECDIDCPYEHEEAK
jgi:DNA phosphorothioation-dependent restriction protein DptG